MIELLPPGDPADIDKIEFLMPPVWVRYSQHRFGIVVFQRKKCRSDLDGSSEIREIYGIINPYSKIRVSTVRTGTFADLQPVSRI